MECFGMSKDAASIPTRDAAMLSVCSCMDPLSICQVISGSELYKIFIKVYFKELKILACS